MRMPSLKDLLLIAAAAVCSYSSAAEKNLAPNPGFEQPAAKGGLPAAWRGDSAVYARDTAVAHTGRASLRFTNADPKKYRLCSARVPLKKGKRYEFSVWVKTKDIRGADTGATICVEWSGADGKWLGGRYPGGVKGTSQGWKLVKGVTPPIPDDAARCSLTCYVRKGMTGTAWFDDVSITRYRPPFLRAMLVKPSYRGWLWPGTKEVVVQARLALDDYELRPGDVTLEAALVEPDSSRVVKRIPPRPAKAALERVALPLADAAPARYAARVTARRRSDGKALGQAEFVLRPPAAARPICYIDEHRRVILNGKPFFPIGMYWSGVNEKDLKLYADSPFNCLMPYGAPNKEKMDLIQRYGLKVIYSIKDYYAGTRYCPKFIQSPADEEPNVRKKVRAFRHHPALLAWYLNDELPASMMPRLDAHQRWVEEEDPNHPTWVVLWQVRDVAQYVNSFDVIGTDPYPVPKRPTSMAAEWTRITLEQVAGARAVWQVPQVFNWAVYKKTPEAKKGLRAPTLAEMRSMTWQCICEGATGIVMYSFFDLKRDKTKPFEQAWREVKQVAGEVKKLSPMLLSVEPAPRIQVQAPKWLHWTVRSHRGKTFLFAANDGGGAGEATFRLPKPPQRVRVVGEGRTIEPRGAEFRGRFERLAVHIYEIHP